MEKTIRQFLLVMIITGVLFSYGCWFTDDLYDEDSEVVVEEMEDGVMEEAEGEEEVVVESEETKVVDSVVTPVPTEPVLTPDSSEAEDPPAAETEPTTEPEEGEDVEPNVEEMEVEGEAAPAESVEEPAEVVEPETAAEPEPTTMYQNGSFTQSGNYFSPEGPESISVTFTIDNDVVTAVNVIPQSSNSTSQQYQTIVQNSAPSLVIGKNLSEIGEFNRISTSSLTPKGFNKAVIAIKAAAKN